MKILRTLILAAGVGIGSLAHAQSVELMKICGEYTQVHNLEKDLKEAGKHGGMASPDAVAMHKNLKKDFEKKKKQFEKESGEKFSAKICKEYDLLD